MEFWKICKEQEIDGKVEYTSAIVPMNLGGLIYRVGTTVFPKHGLILGFIDEESALHWAWDLFRYSSQQFALLRCTTDKLEQILKLPTFTTPASTKRLFWSYRSHPSIPLGDPPFGTIGAELAYVNEARKLGKVQSIYGQYQLTNNK